MTEAVQTTLDATELLAFALVSLTTRALAEEAPGQLTFQQWRTLVVVGFDRAPSRISALATRIGASESSMSRIIRRLETHGLVTSVADPRDRRAALIHLTDAGSNLRSRVVARRRALIAELVGAAAGDRSSDDLAALAAALGPAI